MTGTPTQQGNPHSWGDEGIAGAGWLHVWSFPSHAWPCAVIYGHAWSSVVMHGRAWCWVVMSGHPQLCVVTHGRTLSCMVVNGQAWSYMAGVTSRATPLCPQPGAGPTTKDTRMPPVPGRNVTDDQEQRPAFLRSSSGARAGNRSRGNSTSSRATQD